MAKAKSKVLIVGTGTIGEPLVNLFLKTREEIGIGKVFFHKKRPLGKDAARIKRMVKRGGILVVDDGKTAEFEKKGYAPEEEFSQAANEADVIIDCTPKGNELKETYYQAIFESRGPKIKGFIAQGSEKGFGKPYVYTINDRALIPGEDKFIQVLSCNTHNFLVIPYSIAIKYDGIESIECIDQFICRRASDLSEDKGILGVEADKYSEEEHGNFGSHQAQDGARLLETFIPKEKLPRMHSQVIKLPTQYMHIPMFRLELKNPITLDEVKRRLKANPLVAFTEYESTNRIFGIARDESDILGRILNQTVVVEQSLNVAYGNVVYGTCFTPQDGNALLSSVAATLWLLDPKTYKEKMKVFDKYLFKMI